MKSSVERQLTSRLNNFNLANLNQPEILMSHGNDWGGDSIRADAKVFAEKAKEDGAELIVLPMLEANKVRKGSTCVFIGLSIRSY